MPKIYETQLYNYLKATDFCIGLLVNFGKQKAEVVRRILD